MPGQTGLYRQCVSSVVPEPEPRTLGQNADMAHTMEHRSLGPSAGPRLEPDFGKNLESGLQRPVVVH